MKKSKNRELFEREQKRLERIVEKGTRVGYIYPEDVIPKMPKRVTQQAVEKISKIKPKDLLAMANYLDVETGELIPAEQHAQQLKASTKVTSKKSKDIEVKPIKVKQEVVKPKKEKPKKEKKKKEKPKADTGEQKERRTRGKDKKPRKKREKKVKNYVPTVDILDVVREKLESLTRETYPIIPIESRKNALLEIFEDSITYYSENLDEYRAYLTEKQEELFEILEIIMYDSDEPTVTASFVQAGRILNGSSLSLSQAENLSTMAEISVSE